MNRKLKDHTGKKVGRLTFLRFIRIENHRAIWFCSCDCGSKKEIRAGDLLSGHTKSCGCLDKEKKIERIVTWSKKSYEEKGCKGRRRKDGYSYVRPNNHPLASKEKYVAVHRLVAEEKIGRFLKPKEVVHHWDENPKNNEKENLCILRTNAPHFRLHLFARRHGLKIEELKFEQPWLCP